MVTDERKISPARLHRSLDRASAPNNPGLAQSPDRSPRSIREAVCGPDAAWLVCLCRSRHRTTESDIVDWAEEYEIPQDLAYCMVKAVELGAEYILFDSEAQASNLLPVYEEAS
jgi:hypothetical protein